MKDSNGRELAVGDSVVAWGHGRLRPATVAKIGRAKVTVSLPMEGYTYERANDPAQVTKTSNPAGVAAQANHQATRRETGNGFRTQRATISSAAAFAAAAQLAAQEEPAEEPEEELEADAGAQAAVDATDPAAFGLEQAMEELGRFTA